MTPVKAKIVINRDQIQRATPNEISNASKPMNIGKPPLKNTSPIIKISGKVGKGSVANAASPTQFQVGIPSIENSTNNLTTTRKNTTNLTISLKTQHSTDKLQLSSASSFL